MTLTFDYIIVGAGSAGCVLANRLSADPANRVLIVEAGPRDWNPLLRVPMMAGQLWRGRYANWSYMTEPEPNLGNRRMLWPRGKVLGGSSSINGMIYARGNAADYDHWAQMGLSEWSYERVLPYFKRTEAYQPGGDDFRGSDGALPVSRPDTPHPFYDAYLDAARQAGHNINPDFNGAEQEGFGRYDYTILDGQRWSAARAFLDPARVRPNLTILTGSPLLRIVIEAGKATGIEVLGRGKRKVVLSAAREVILAAGAVASPALLMHSGIGEPDELQRLRIPVNVPLREVGRNLQDHLNARLMHRSTVPDQVFDFLRIDRSVLGMARALFLRNGFAASFPTEGGAFVRTTETSETPDIQVHFIIGLSTAALRHPFSKPQPGVATGPGFTGCVCQLRPESRGSISLRDSDPLSHPAIRANYLATEHDRTVMRNGVKMMRDVFAQPAFDAIRGEEVAPGREVQTDAQIDAWVAANASTIFHPVGTCRMGVDENSVVDPQLRVRGVSGLRVIDASVMPTIVSANTHAATMMIAEKGSEMILAAA